MLVLSRREGERIVIGGDVVVTVLGSTGNRVRLGISAPRRTPIHREEVLRRCPRRDAGSISADDSFLAESI
ncbi:MAG: carbon storage regulator [Planctomycetota bacterium]|nr:MAG: carbon storage regulator [Planctomycetota bacterium]